ncbi:hypothetical protein Nepgr_017119 [Nepenthes gracilis]|uniref:Uncharacterized protein n=1 Tax=Nepenthes gracilis TaxID=150966 RepID=A0AAD3SPU5_NEPGR|nr:hypothetical protein Nepgr_017119 [Nepenthes gracilis]
MRCSANLSTYCSCKRLSPNNVAISLAFSRYAFPPSSTTTSLNDLATESRVNDPSSSSLGSLLSWHSLRLLGGVALNDQHYCYDVKPGAFAGAAVLPLISVTFGILYRLTFTSGKSGSSQWSSSPTVPNQWDNP